MRHRIALILTLSLVTLSTLVQAQDKGRIEAYGGIYYPRGLSDKATFGGRAGAKLSDHFGLEGSVGRVTFDFGSDKIRATLADLSLKGYLTTGGKAQVFLFAGPGWAFVHAHGVGQQADSFTANAGLGVDVRLADHLYLRPDVRGRWFKKSDSNSLEWESTLALGYSF